ncbi:M57 family metalloprotease [Bacteroides sp.]|uniref:M57 family metalloprotease n=1 Tax=Bacteroides sp. TaxID=29523 RepID=UPI003AB28DF3
MNTRYVLNSLLVLCYSMLLALTSACNNELEAVKFEEQQSISTGDDMRIIQALGFDTLDIVELKSAYLIQGDMLFEKSNLSTYSQAQTRQAYHTTGLIGHPKQRSITVGIDSSIPTSGVDNWRDEIQEAINLWNPLSNLKMTYTTAANPDILIRSDASDPLPDYVIAAAAWPMNEKPGSSIRINLDYKSNRTIPRLQKIYNMVHELGHCFGLRHTNWKSEKESEANHIGGTPDSDPYSVMNGGTADYSWNGFSEGDKNAIEYLYPSTFKADFVGYPQEVKHWGVDVHRLRVNGNHPIVAYEAWGMSGGWVVRTYDDSADVVFGSPYTSSAYVQITTIYGEKYGLSRSYVEQITKLSRLN